MPLNEKDRLWLRMFHKVTSGRATVEECNAFGVSDAKRQEFYNARYAKRADAMRKRVVLRRPMSDDFGNKSESPMDALVEMIDRKRKR
jgi:hypothetical protein